MYSQRNIINSLPWSEKHRPGKIVGVKIDENIKKQIQKMITNRDIPNIILEGPPGVGKTSTIKCIAREMYGKYYGYMVLEMNASDDRGIKIQESIENFRRAYVHIDDADKDKVPTFKMVILDEADNMTDKAKHIISSFIKNCIKDIRFAFTCNIKNNISSSIQSGCHIIKYPPLSDEILFDRLKEICVKEKVNTENKELTKESAEELAEELNKGLKAIIEISNGDLRSAINTLQLTYNRFDKITRDNVYAINDRPHPEKSKEIIVACCDGKLDKALKKVVEMKYKGYSGTDIAMGLRFALRSEICSDIPEEIKISFWDKISYASYNISKGLDASIIQISACVADMYLEALRLKKLK